MVHIECHMAGGRSTAKSNQTNFLQRGIIRSIWANNFCTFGVQKYEYSSSNRTTIQKVSSGSCLCVHNKKKSAHGTVLQTWALVQIARCGRGEKRTRRSFLKHTTNSNSESHKNTILIGQWAGIWCISEAFWIMLQKLPISHIHGFLCLLFSMAWSPKKGNLTTEKNRCENREKAPKMRRSLSSHTTHVSAQKTLCSVQKQQNHCNRLIHTRFCPKNYRETRVSQQ